MSKAPYLIGIAGGSGSGKTSLIRALRAELPQGIVALVSQDDYYHPQEQQQRDSNGEVNYDLPTAIDMDGLVRDIDRLTSGSSIHKREYTFNQEGQEPRMMEVLPAPVVLVEGLFVLHHKSLRERFDLKVFVEASEASQLERRIRRDAQERGYGRETVQYQWDNHVLPAYREYLLPYRPICDLHIMNEKGFDRAIPVLRDHVLLRAGIASRAPRLQVV